MNTTITETEYLTETKFRAAVKKLLGNSVHSKKETDDMRSASRLLAVRAGTRLRLSVA